MITIFNRKELTMVNTIEQQAKTCDLLASHHIRYYIKADNRFSNSSGRDRTSSYGLNMDTAYEYTFYVHKNDYEIARAILSGKIEN